MQHSIFGEEKIHTGLKVITQNKSLTKNQQAFNRLSGRIANLRKQIENEGERLRTLNGVYNAEVRPLLTQMGEEKIVLAKKLAAAYKKIKLTEKQKDEVEDIILDLLEDAFTVIKPDEESEILYSSLSHMSYAESLQEEKEEMKEELKEEVFDRFGIDLDMDNFDESPEGYAHFQQQLKQKIEQQQQAQGERKKTKKQLAKEASLQQQQEIKQRSIRSIYMGLVKLLHPDTETDEVVKIEKEEVMKRLTRAYDEKDLSTLLQLELQWIAKENDHLEKLSDDTLKIYIAVLKEQVKELEFEKALQLNNPAFAPVVKFVDIKENFAVNAIRQEKNDRIRYIGEIKRHSKLLEAGKTRAAIMECIDFFSEDISERDMDSFQEALEQMMRNGPFSM